jgi:hypothetical protein
MHIASLFIELSDQRMLDVGQVMALSGGASSDSSNLRYCMKYKSFNGRDP